MMKDFNKEFLFGVLLLTLSLSGGANPQKQEAKIAPTSPAKSPITFTAASAGLPTAGKWKSSPRFHDINGDGNLDLAAYVRLGLGAGVWFGDGAGGWVDATEGLEFEKSKPCGGQLDLGDVNGDGKVDLVTADHCHGVFVYLGDGQGHWQPVTEKLNSAKFHAKQKEFEGDSNPYKGAEGLALGDVNEDGFMDIVSVASDIGGFAVYLGDGSGKMWKEVTEADGLPSADDPDPGDEIEAGWAHEVKLQDMNGDGHLDVVATYYAGPRVWHGKGAARWTAASQGLLKTVFGGVYMRIAIADINHDGRLDLAVSNMVNGAEAFLQKQDGSWQALPDPMPDLKGGAYGIGLGDLDGDGNVDMLIGGRLSSKDKSHGVFVLLGDGKGGWRRIHNTHIPETGLPLVWGFDVADVNKDGRQDVALTLNEERQRKKKDKTEESIPLVQVWLNQKDSTSNIK